MLRFANEHLLHFLWLLPLLILFYYWAFRSKRKAMARFGNLDIINKLTRNVSRKRQLSKILMLFTAFFFLIIAAARPQIGTKMEQVQREGIDIIVALDVSASMLAQDIKPNRLQKAKHEVTNFVELLKGDRIGLIAFAGVPFVQCPLTLDYGAAKIFLDVMDPDLIPTPGTAIGEAINLATTAFEKKERKHKVLVLITDGEDHEGNALKYAEEAEREGIVIHCVGIGSPQGEPIPVADSPGTTGKFKKNKEGDVIISKLDEVTLEKIALQTGGKYYRATSGQVELQRIYDEIAEMEKKELGSMQFSQYEDRYQYLLFFAILLLMLEPLVPERKKIKTEWRGRFM